MTGPLASKYTWLHGGSLSLAVEAMTGKRPEYIFADVRDPDKAGLINAEDALRREFRVRLFNRKWLEGMMKEGYAGADHMRVMASNSFGWEVMRPGSVGNENWSEMKRVLVDDKLKLNLRDWMERNNPYAFQDTTAVMLEAIRKGYWEADAETTQQLANEYAQSVARHGLSGHMTSGGNQPLDALVRQKVEGSPGAASQELLAQYIKRIDDQVPMAAADPAIAANAPGTAPGEAATASTVPAGSSAALGSSTTPTGSGDASGKPAATPPPNPADVSTAQAAKNAVVSGQKLERTDSPNQPAPNAVPQLLTWWVTAAALLFLVTGFAMRRGAP